MGPLHRIHSHNHQHNVCPRMTLNLGLLLLVLSGLVFHVHCEAGVDLSVATTSDDWTCLIKSKNVSYAIVRAYRNIGDVDIHGAESIKLAFSAGIDDLGAYIFPCITSSPYAINKNIVCDSPEVQVDKTITFLRQNGVFVKHSYRAIEDNLSAPPVFINRMWIDIEDELPSIYYDPTTSTNKDFIARMVVHLNKMKIPVGIYTTKTYWAQIMDNVEGYSKYPLWYPRYDAVDSMDFFSPFGGMHRCTAYVVFVHVLRREATINGGAPVHVLVIS